MEDAALLEEAVGIARRAGGAIMEIYGSDFDVTEKADDSPLTQADLNAHRVITAGLRALTPELPIVSEEQELPPYAQRRQWQRYWLVDPLDGTKEFVQRNGEFTVNIALIEAHRPLLGVVAVPARDEIFLGHVGEQRAELRTPQGRTPLAARPFTTREKLTLVVSRSHGGERLERFIEVLRQGFPNIEAVPIGSALKLCILAQAQADLYPRLGPTSEWDIGAAQAVLEASGGAVWSFEREPLRYNAEDSLLNPEFVAVADPGFDWWRYLPRPEQLADGLG